MNKRTFKGLGAIVALFAAGIVNAESITLTPSATNVTAGESFTLTVGGSGFTNDMTVGSLLLSWDTNFLSLTTADTDIVTALQGIGFDGDFTDATTVAGSVDITMDTPFIPTSIPVAIPNPPGTIDFLTLTFMANAATSATDIISSLGTFAAWGDGSDNPITIDPYGSATVTVNAVPVPAAVWLFGSGLIGLAGIARRSTTKAAA